MGPPLGLIGGVERRAKGVDHVAQVGVLRPAAGQADGDDGDAVPDSRMVPAAEQPADAGTGERRGAAGQGPAQAQAQRMQMNCKSRLRMPVS